MTCVRCGKELESGAAFCAQCGLRVGDSAVRRLVRLPAAGRVAGVCAGIAAYLDADVTVVRLLWIVLSIVPGGIVGGVIAYLAAWLVMPEALGAAPAVHTKLTRSVRDRKLGGVCGGIAEYLGVDSTVVRVAWAVLAIVPGCIVLGVLAYVAAWFIMPEAPGSSTVMAPASHVA
jgi:phage shock protein PspC (stress-responsive transcriptional regulator)